MLNHGAPRATLRRGLLPLAAWVVIGTFITAAPVRGDELQEANQLLKAGRHAQALARVNEALAAKPRDAQARFLKGVILTDQGSTRAAVEIFSRLTQDFPELPEPYNNLAVIYAAQGHYDKARAALEQSIRTHPSYATAYENLGDVYARLASQAYDKALQLDQANTGAQTKLSLVREISRTPARVAAMPPREPAAEVLEVISAWAQAWSNRDVDAYLAHYAGNFRTPEGQPRAEWEKVRRARVSAPKSISVEIGSPQVVLQGENQASVTFQQAYRSDTFKSNSRKTLELIRSEGRWLIRDERSD